MRSKEQSVVVESPRKRYYVFGGQNMYPFGGWKDLKGSFYDLEEAIKFSRKVYRSRWMNWSHVVDIETEEIVHFLEK